MVQVFGVCMNNKAQKLLRQIYWRITTLVLYCLRQVMVSTESAKQTSVSWKIIKRDSVFTEI
jgi:hypothetical protein